MFFSKFLQDVKILTMDDVDKLRIKLEDFMNCTITFSGKTWKCNLENVMGSFFTRDVLPQFCYTIYSLWGDVNKKPERIPKGAVMKLDFFLNASRKSEKSNISKVWEGSSNIPTSPYVQIGVHSPYYLPSPYLEGTSYNGGKSYEMRITMNEKNLLPLPYQTNCTDYMTPWKHNGGRGPIDQLSVVQECRATKWYKAAGCVPITVDYPHTYPICGTNITNAYTVIVAEDECTLLADNYNQPCNSITYEVEKAEKDIIIIKKIEIRTAIPFHDCKDMKMWTPECSTINIEILFDRFEITNLTYFPKFEELELFSVLGGYMGMWLGISLISIYDFVGSLLVYLRMWHRNRSKGLGQRKCASLQRDAVRGTKNSRMPAVY